MQEVKGIARIGQKPDLKLPVVYSIGHSNVKIDVFLELLKSANIQVVIDCRSKPQSRWRQFGHSAIARHLIYAGIMYEWRGNNIGGLSGNTNYKETLDELAERAANERLVLLCSEGKPEQCHRYTVLAPDLEKRGITVVHLRYMERSKND